MAPLRAVHPCRVAAQCVDPSAKYAFTFTSLMAVFPTDKPTNLQRAFLIGVQTHDMPAGEAVELLGELKELVENLRLTIVDSILVNLRSPTPALLLGSGKAQELADQAKARSEEHTSELQSQSNL